MTWRKRLAMIMATAFLIITGSTVLAQPAAADICKDAPAPVGPKSGLPGLLTSPPKEIPPPATNPFTDPAVPIGDVYGHTWTWANYDLGCGNDFLRDPQAVTNTATANLFLSFTGAQLAALDAIDQMSRATGLDWLTDMTRRAAEVLRDPALGVWFPIALLALGCLIVWRATKMSYQEVARILMVVAAAAALAVFTLVTPAKAAQLMDRAVVGVVEVAGAQFPTSATDAITRESAYRTWLAGNFGDPDSATAQTYGPRLMAATHYTWAEWQQIQADGPAANTGATRAAIDKQKAADFKALAKELEKADPAAYEQFTGRGERTGPAILGNFVVFAMGLFVLIAAGVVLVARVMMQGLCIAAPIAAIMGIFPTHSHVLHRMWGLFTASLVAAAKFVIASGVMTLVLGGLYASDTGSGNKLFWTIVITVAAIVITKPIRSLKTVLPGVDANKSYLKSAVGTVASFRQALPPNVVQPDPPKPTAAPTSAPAQAAPTPPVSLPPLPAPTWEPLALPAGTSTARPAWDAEEWAPYAPPAPRAPRELPVGSPAPVAPPETWEEMAERRQRAGEVTVEHRRTHHQLPAGTPPAVRVTGQPAIEAAPVVVAGEVVPDAPAARVRDTSAQPQQDLPVARPVPLANPRYDTTLYTAAEHSISGEPRVWSEPELAEDGTEHDQVLYHPVDG